MLRPMLEGNRSHGAPSIFRTQVLCDACGGTITDPETALLARRDGASEPYHVHARCLRALEATLDADLTTAEMGELPTLPVRDPDAGTLELI